MISLYDQIAVKVSGNEGLDEKYYYRVIGTYHRSFDKDMKPIDQDFFMVLKPDGQIVNVFPSKCKIKRVQAAF